MVALNILHMHARINGFFKLVEHVRNTTCENRVGHQVSTLLVSPASWLGEVINGLKIDQAHAPACKLRGSPHFGTHHPALIP
jgi:hypothetical protein